MERSESTWQPMPPEIMGCFTVFAMAMLFHVNSEFGVNSGVTQPLSFGPSPCKQ